MNSNSNGDAGSRLTSNQCSSNSSHINSRNTNLFSNAVSKIASKHNNTYYHNINNTNTIVSNSNGCYDYNEVKHTAKYNTNINSNSKVCSNAHINSKMGSQCATTKLKSRIMQ